MTRCETLRVACSPEYSLIAFVGLFDHSGSDQPLVVYRPVEACPTRFVVSQAHISACIQAPSWPVRHMFKISAKEATVVTTSSETARTQKPWAGEQRHSTQAGSKARSEAYRATSAQRILGSEAGREAVKHAADLVCTCTQQHLQRLDRTCTALSAVDSGTSECDDAVSAISAISTTSEQLHTAHTRDSRRVSGVHTHNQ